MGEAIALDARDATLRYLYGLMLADAGRRDRAVEEFRQAAILGARTSIAERARQRLRAMRAPVPEERPAPGARVP